jgi:hypothetical protein
LSTREFRTRPACSALTNGPVTNLGKTFLHATVDHPKRQYVVGAVHTQTIEAFSGIFKRGVVGSLHKARKKYRPPYAAEFQFRHNNRFNADIFSMAIEGC